MLYFGSSLIINYHVSVLGYSSRNKVGQLIKKFLSSFPFFCHPLMLWCVFGSLLVICTAWQLVMVLLYSTTLSHPQTNAISLNFNAYFKNVAATFCIFIAVHVAIWFIFLSSFPWITFSQNYMAVTFCLSLCTLISWAFHL